MELTLKRNLGKGYGGKALDIYSELCGPFGWDRGERYQFGPQRPLYAKEVTPEGYSVWFIAHSNFTGSSGGMWKNKIEGEVIYEYWEQPREDLNDDDIRLTFAKLRGTYVFLGIYNLAGIQVTTNSNGRKMWIKTYQLIEETYPADEGDDIFIEST